MKRDKMCLCKASFVAQPLGHAASTLAQPGSPSAWTKTRSLRGCRNFYLLILPSLSFSLSFSLSLLLLILDRSDVCRSLLCVCRLNFAPKLTCRAKKIKHLLCSHRHTTVIAGPICLIAHLLAPHDRAFSLKLRSLRFHYPRLCRVAVFLIQTNVSLARE